jgi:hypothetical protein
VAVTGENGRLPKRAAKAASNKRNGAKPTPGERKAAATPKWKEFEALIAELHRTAAPDAKVEHNQTIKGKETGRNRQIDVLIRKDVDLFPARISVLIVLECKRYKRVVGIDKVEAFVTKLRDVGATQGAMVSITGFDAGARAAAARYNVTLLEYRQALDADWQAVFGPGSWASWRVMRFEKLNVGVFLEGKTKVPDVRSDTQLLNGQGSAIVTIGDLITAIEQSPIYGSFTRAVQGDVPLYIRDDDGQLRRIKSLVIKGERLAREYVVNHRLASGHVLEDSQDESIRLLEMYSEGWAVQELFAPDRGRALSPQEWNAAQADPKGFRAVIQPEMRHLRMVIRKADPKG